MFKSIKITEKTHELLKNYCKNNNLKLNSWVESLIKNKLEKEDELSKSVSMRKNNKL